MLGDSIEQVLFAIQLFLHLLKLSLKIVELLVFELYLVWMREEFDLRLLIHVVEFLND